MAFWTNKELKVKRQHKFLVTVGPASVTNLFQFFAMEASRPSFSISEHAHAFLDHKFKFPGTATWSDVTMRIADVRMDDGVEGDSGNAIYQMLMAAGYQDPAEVANQGTPLTINKESAVNALGMFNIKQIQANMIKEDLDKSLQTYAHGTAILDEWNLVNPWIKSVAFGSNSYTSEAINSISLTISYDYATFTAEPNFTSPTAL